MARKVHLVILLCPCCGNPAHGTELVHSFTTAKLQKDYVQEIRSDCQHCLHPIRMEPTTYNAFLTMPDPVVMEKETVHLFRFHSRITDYTMHFVQADMELPVDEVHCNPERGTIVFPGERAANVQSLISRASHITLRMNREITNADRQPGGFVHFLQWHENTFGKCFRIMPKVC